MLMDAIELRRRGVELLSPVLVPYGFVYQAGEVDCGRRRTLCSWRLARANRSAEFAALVTKAERTRPPRGLAALSPGHHPARLGLDAPQDATGAERCAVSVGPVDRTFATPSDSPGQCEPGLPDDRPR